jgi:hypothetical protein
MQLIHTNSFASVSRLHGPFKAHCNVRDGIGKGPPPDGIGKGPPLRRGRCVRVLAHLFLGVPVKTHGQRACLTEENARICGILGFEKMAKLW